MHRTHRRTLFPCTLAALLAASLLAIGCTDDAVPTALTHDDVTAARFGAASHSPHQAAHRNFRAQLSGAEEVPAVDTRARGQTIFQVSADRTQIHYRLIVANLHDVTMAHIHIGEAGVNGPVVVWLYPDAPPPQPIPGRTSGVLATGVITAESLVGQWAGEPLETLLSAMQEHSVYVNVHTTEHPAGEIRGQITP